MPFELMQLQIVSYNTSVVQFKYSRNRVLYMLDICLTNTCGARK